MVTEAKQFGLLLFPRHEITLTPSSYADDEMHNSRLGVPGRFYRRRTRDWGPTWLGQPTVHESVFLRKENNPGYQPWILATPNTYELESWPTELRKVRHLV